MTEEESKMPEASSEHLGGDDGGARDPQDVGPRMATSTGDMRQSMMTRRGSMLRRSSARGDHLQTLFLKKKIRNEMVSSMSDTQLSRDLVDEESEDFHLMHQLIKEVEQEMVKERESQNLEEIKDLLSAYGVSGSTLLKQYPLDVRMQEFSYAVQVKKARGGIATVYTSSFLFPITDFLRRVFRQGERPKDILGESHETRKQVLSNISLVFEPGKSYLLLGPPASGKSSLLKAIAGLIRPSSEDEVSGCISYNGRTLEEKNEFHIENAFAYIDQLDKHAPRLTVEETFQFAYKCKNGARLYLEEIVEDPKLCAETAVKAEAERLPLKILLSALGLTGVKDTFVGDADVRGVSGGQRRRVTVGEMLTARVPILAGDEISTGLDASSTYDMCQVLVHFSKGSGMTRIFALLQPSPQTVSLFDEVIVLAEGRILYAGPVDEVEDYFAEIGFLCPQFMDVADFLQMVSTEEGASLFNQSASLHGDRKTAPTVSELADIFRASDAFQRIQEKLEAPHRYVWSLGDRVSQHNGSQVSRVSMSAAVNQKFANKFPRSTWLVFRRFITLWKRDRRVIIAGAAKNILMGVSVGGCYLSTTNAISIQGALFQAGLFIMLGAMQSASAMVTDRIIYYKHSDANFYSAWPFMFGRAMSQIPQTLSDTIMFATIMYFMIGLADRVDVVNFFIYLSLLFIYALLMIQHLAIFGAFASSGTLNALSAFLLLLLILFGGFIVSPATIPNYYIWIYWWNPFAWLYRALIVNEFYSGRWEDPEIILINTGFTDAAGNPYTTKWIKLAYAYLIPYTVVCLVLTAVILSFVRNEGGKAPESVPHAKGDGGTEEKKVIEIPFKPVTMSFRDICYDVSASTGKETLRLLENVNGVFRAGRMCALMGTSGAGKTTLMDVIALRKRSGTVNGSVRLNGWPQEAISFRRCSGFVEQFDVQTPQLTVRESIYFSAKLRLDPKLVTTDEEIAAFVDQVMATVELSNLADALVGTEEEAGLSFEQKKRLSIAIELAAAPSIIFLDEPTSGLDARSALIVVRTLRAIADGGRTICATIHQPSSAVFSMFDDLLLLKRGGRTVYHGELGDENCSTLVRYFESHGATPIELGENPANWMLRIMDSMADLNEVFLHSKEQAKLLEALDEIENDPKEESKISFEHEFGTNGATRRKFINKRLRTIYWRSPTYNYSRLFVSLVIAFILATVFVTNRAPSVFTEADMRSRVSVIFLSFIIIGIMAMLSVLPVMTQIRDMFYRHRDANMYDSGSMGLALGVAEKWFIVLSCTIFTILFIPTGGFTDADEPFVRRLARSVSFWGFFTFNFAIYSYFGQLFVCLVKGTGTALVLSSVFIGLNNFFAGLVVRPQFMVGTFYAVPYYICPGHYIYQGLVVSVYGENNDTVVASNGSEFQTYLVDAGQCTLETPDCNGTISEYIDSFFGGEFGDANDPPVKSRVICGIVLGFILVLSRLLTWLALKYIRFAS